MSDLQPAPEAPVVVAPQPDVEQPRAEEDPAQSDPPADAQPQEGEEGDKKARRHVNAIQKRIDELTRERHDERRRADAAEARARELETKFRTAETQAAEPKIEQFQQYDDYLRAYAKWEAKTIVSAELEKFAKTNLQTFEQRAQQEQAVAQAQQFDRALQSVEQDGSKKYADFVKVVSEGPQLGPQMGQMVLSTERPAEISYYLAKNPEVGIALANMHPMHAAREIGKLEAMFTSKRVTSAPPPPKTVGSSDKSPKGLSDDLPADEWYRRRQAQIRNGG